MNKVFLVLFTLAFIFSFDLKALAAEGHSHDQNIKQATEKFKDGSTNTQQENSADHTNMDHESGSGHEDMDMSGGSGHEDMDMSGGSGHEDMDMSGGSGHEDMNTNSESEHEGGHHLWTESNGYCAI